MRIYPSDLILWIYTDFPRTTGYLHGFTVVRWGKGIAGGIVLYHYQVIGFYPSGT
jgi:hypothetical protein